VLHALNVSGQLDVSEFENLEMLQSALGVSAETFLEGSGQLSTDLEQRLEQRDDIIGEIDEKYASDQLKYIYYHLGWLYLDLTSRETEYVDDFARNYLNLGIELLPSPSPKRNAGPRTLQACFKAYQETEPLSPVVGRYFYKRYRSLLLRLLDSAELTVAAQTERLKRETRLILENWDPGQSDTLDFLLQLAPPALKPYFPHVIAANLDPAISLPRDLPAKTDKRLYRHVTRGKVDDAAANTARRLGLLDQTDIYRSLPAEVMLTLAQKLSLLRLAAGETVIWQGERNDDVYFLLEGRLEVLLTRNGTEEAIGQIEPGEIFGEIAFFTEDPRYATVRATEPARCFVLTDADLQLVAYRHPTILMQMAAALAKRLADQYHTDRKETV
jgi:hypothetical protein